MVPEVGRSELLAMVRSAHADWEALLREIPPAWLTEPGLPGGWSVKDVIAHITWGEREALGLMAARALVGSDLWRLTDDERNAIVFQQNRHRDLDDVLAESREIFTRYLEALEALSEEDLNDPRRFAGMPLDWRPWRVLYDPHHYQHHAADIRAWLETRWKTETA